MRLTDRLERLEGEANRALVREYAAAHGLDVDELWAEFEAIMAAGSAYMAAGLSREQALRRVAADLGHDYDELMAQHGKQTP